MGIYELMTMTSQIREMTFKGESDAQIVRKMARKQGMHTLFEDGMIKALKGLTTLEEVLRITQQEIAARAGHQDVSRRADDVHAVESAALGASRRLRSFRDRSRSRILIDDDRSDRIQSAGLP